MPEFPVSTVTDTASAVHYDASQSVADAPTMKVTGR